MKYTVTTTHELTESELVRAPKGLKRSSIVQHFSLKAEAIAAFEYEKILLGRLGFTDSLKLCKGDDILLTT